MTFTDSIENVTMQIIVYANKVCLYIIVWFIYTDYSELSLSVCWCPFLSHTDIHTVMSMNKKYNDFTVKIHSVDIFFMILSLLDAMF